MELRITTTSREEREAAKDVLRRAGFEGRETRAVALTYALTFEAELADLEGLRGDVSGVAPAALVNRSRPVPGVRVSRESDSVVARVRHLRQNPDRVQPRSGRRAECVRRPCPGQQKERGVFVGMLTPEETSR